MVMISFKAKGTLQRRLHEVTKNHNNGHKYGTNWMVLVLLHNFAFVAMRVHTAF